MLPLLTLSDFLSFKKAGLSQISGKNQKYFPPLRFIYKPLAYFSQAILLFFCHPGVLIVADHISAFLPGALAEARVTLKIRELALPSRSDQMALNTATKCSAM
jgi:hypothetical protein